MSYSASDINDLLRDFLKKPEGQKLLKDNKVDGKTLGVYTNAQLKQIAQDIKNDLIKAYTSVISTDAQADVSHYFNATNIHITPTLNGVVINFEEDALYRPSLSIGKSYTGYGIKDIFSLISGGTISTDTVVKGEWRHISGKSIWTRGKLPRRAKPFVRAVIKKYRDKYKDLTITYPDSWK